MLAMFSVNVHVYRIYELPQLTLIFHEAWLDGAVWLICIAPANCCNSLYAIFTKKCCLLLNILINLF